MNELIKRKPCRLKGCDYSLPGAYFVTICVKDRKHLLGKINVGEGLAPPGNRLTVYGNIAKEQIELLESRYSVIKIDRYVVMPNHIHMIISILKTEGINPFPTIKYDIPNVVGKFKAGVTRIVGNAFMHSAINPIFQPSFHDHVIRGDEDYQKIAEYIDTNVLRWEKDCFYR